jgi:hypothetical protein
VSSVVTTTQKIRAPDESRELKLVEFLSSLRNRTWKDIRQTLSSLRPGIRFLDLGKSNLYVTETSLLLRSK